MQEDQDAQQFKVLMNHEEQYSLWPATKKIPSGWRDAGKTGEKDECLEFIKHAWVDMRPLSLRQTI